jgi:transcriptional regulator with XRE-family HTH domain
VDDDQQSLARSLGASIRAARRAAGLTLAELAKRTELSQPFLSQAENGNVMPSVINLHRIAQALATTAHALLEQGTRTPTRVVRAGDARTYALGPSAVLRFCVEGTRLMDCNEVAAEPHSAAESATTHAGEEFVYVISGAIRFSVDGDEHYLNPGDTIYYAATSPHQWFNDSDHPAKFLFIGTPPGF